MYNDHKGNCTKCSPVICTLSTNTLAVIKSKYVAISKECSTRDGDRQCTRNVYNWPVHAIRAYKGAGVHVSLQVLSSALDGLNSRPRPPYSRRGWVGPRAGMDAVLPPPGIELRFLWCPLRSLVVTPTTLSRPWTLIIPEKRERKCPQISEIFPQTS